MWVSGMAGWGTGTAGWERAGAEGLIRPIPHVCAELCEHTGWVCAWDTHAHKHTCSETTLVAPAHTVWAGAGRAGLT